MPTAATMPMYEVTAPAVVPYPFGIASVAATPAPADLHWQAGVWWLNHGCGPAGITYNQCTVDSVPAALPANVPCGYDTAAPFTVFARSNASLGGMPLEMRDQQARDLLIAGEQHEVEEALWALLLAETGVAAATAANLHEAVAMADALVPQVYGGTPVLHLSRYAASMAVAQYALRIDGRRLVSPLGSDVIAGAGYGTPPTATGPALDVIGTGPVVLVRGDVQVFNEARNPVTNQLDTLVYRNYVVGWDCTAVRVHMATP